MIKKTGEVVTSEARGRNISEFTGHSGWKGFFRPQKENPNKENKSKNKKKENSGESKPEFFKRVMESQKTM